MSSPVLHMFWIAEYADGKALPQFDPDTGLEHKFSEVDQSKLVKFGWYNFTPSLVIKVPHAVANPLVSTCTVTIPEGHKLIAYRTNALKFNLSGEIKGHEAIAYVLGIEGKFKMIIRTDGVIEVEVMEK